MQPYGRFLKSTLEERLTFYANLLQRLRQSVEEEETDRIEYYRGLEQETLRSIETLERCIASLADQTPSPAPRDGGGTEAEEASGLEADLDARVALARAKALEAAQLSCRVARKQLESLRSRLNTVKGRSLPLTYQDAVPLHLDFDA